MPQSIKLPLLRLNKARLQRALSYCTAKRTPGAVIPPRWIALTDETSAFLKDQGVPKVLSDFLAKFSFGTPLTLGSLVLERMNYVPDENLEDHNQRCIAEGLLIVGSGLNGDPIVIDLHNQGRVGFVKHGEFWGSAPSEAARDFLELTPFDMGSFFLAAALYNDEEGVYFPVDAYYTHDRNESGGWENEYSLTEH